MSDIRIPLAAYADMPDGALRRFRAGFRSVWVRRSGETVSGFFDSCTHQGGALRAQGEILVCGRHGATFNAHSGRRLSGEAPEGSVLAPADVRVTDGQIFLHLPITD